MQVRLLATMVAEFEMRGLKGSHPEGL